MKRFISALIVSLLAVALLPGLAIGGGVTPQYEDLTGYEFVVGSVYSLSDTVDWSHDHYNYGSLPDSVTYGVSRTRSASCSTSVQVSVSGLVGMVGGAEVAVGTSDTESWSVTFNIAAYSWAELSSGSHRKKSTGTEKYWWHGVLQSSTPVNGTFSKNGYSKKVEHPLP